MIEPSELYKELEVLKSDINKATERVSNLENAKCLLTLRYRIESVNRVIDFIRANKGRIINTDSLLCHCQNKLVGNIDGVELDLSDRLLKGEDKND